MRVLYAQEQQQQQMHKRHHAAEGRVYNVSIERTPPSLVRPHPKLLGLDAALLSAAPSPTTAPVAKAVAAALPPAVVDLRPRMPPVYDQGTLGSCTANALCGALQYASPALGTGSRLFVYYNERVLESSTSCDSGARLCDGVLSLERYGVCPERTWPYDITRFALPPTQTCYADAALNKLPTAHSVPPNAAAMKQCLALGHPFVVGIAVFGSFETVQVATTGVVPMPQPAVGDQLLGGHAVLCVGYDDVRKRWIMRNSWGRSWGEAGYFYLDYAYLLDPGLASDAWMLC